MTTAYVILGCWTALLLLAQRQFYQIALLGFPGVILHELMHLTVGIVLLAKPSSFSLIPRRIGNHWQFGSVSFTGLNLFNSAPVAYAPLLLLPAAWLAFHHWMVPFVLAQQYSEAILSGYLIGCALLYSLPSVTDIKVGGLSTLFWFCIGVAGCWFWRWPQALFN